MSNASGNTGTDRLAEYDPNAPLRERVETLADADVSLEVEGSNGKQIAIQKPHGLRTLGDGTIRVVAGRERSNFSWEIVLPEVNSESPRLEKVTPNQLTRSYVKARMTWVEIEDVRVKSAAENDD